jgi:geranylgeranyl transferase type-2 subunit alpha
VQHGRLKVRTTEEQERLKQQERAAKLAAFRKLTGALHALRQQPSTLVDPEPLAKALSLSALLLAKQPDIGSAWNFRRELLQATVTPATAQQLCEEEFDFLDACLRDSPKSYGVWHHRAWVLQLAPAPPWKKELEKCALFLSLDSRNCWLG